MQKKVLRFDIIRPEPECLLQSARSFGYSIETALADLVDNSITAGASRVDITFGIDHNSFVRIEDDGKGMNEIELINAMRMGSLNATAQRDPNDLGRFGLGLKTASFSQCTRLTVKTKIKLGDECVKCLDLEIVSKEREWVLLRNFADKYSSQNAGSLRSPVSGTIVLLEKLDRLLENSSNLPEKEHFFRKFDSVVRHLGLVFHRYIESGDITISISNQIIPAVNPFHISEKFPSTELQEEQLSLRGNPIVIQPFILPHESRLSEEEKKQVQISKGLADHQGIYLYRNKRLISDGGWLDLGFRKKESQRLCRIAIDIPNTLDKEWQIDVKKASAKIPDSIRKRLKTICSSAIEKAIKVYTHRGAYIRRKGNDGEIVYLWLSKQKKGLKSYHINEQHPLFLLLKSLLVDHGPILKDYAQLLAESIPVSLIVNDFADPFTIIDTPLNDHKEKLLEIFKSSKKALIDAGLTNEEASKSLMKMEVFQKINI